MIREMKIPAIYPKSHLSRANPEYKIHAYLVKDVTIARKDPFWAADIS